MLSQTLGTHRHEIITSEDHLQVKDDPILESYQIRTMRDNEALFLFANKKPIKLSITRFFESRAMLKQTKLEPAVQATGKKKSIELMPLEKIEIDTNKIRGGSIER